MNYWKSWQIPDWEAMRSCLADSIIFGGQQLDAQECVLMCRSGNPWKDVQLLAEVFQENNGALLYEGTDSVTGQVMRVGEFISLEDGKIVASIASFGSGLPPQ